MKVEVHLYTVLKEYIPKGVGNPFVVTLLEKSTVQNLIDALGINYCTDAMAIIINGKGAKIDTMLNENDIVDLAPEITGGI